MSITTESQWASSGGELLVQTHDSDCCHCNMRYAVYVPPAARGKADNGVPVLWYLSGLTCSWANVMEKAGIQRIASELGVMIIAPDTSPRGDAVADDEAYDLGQGAGFYLTAAESPWQPHFAMDQYITDELTQLITDTYPFADMQRQGITGHSMGGHGALTLHLKHPDTFRSVSAFSPIVSPSSVPWGRKAFENYLGVDESKWLNFDATALVKHAASDATILIDTGDADPFLDEHLKPDSFLAACEKSGQKVNYRMQPGYDHSYYFVASFIADHVRHHADALSSV